MIPVTMPRTPVLVVALLVGVVACGEKTPPAAPVEQPTLSPEALAPAPVQKKAPFPDRVDQVVALLQTGIPENATKALTRLDTLSREQPDKAELYFNKGVAYEIIGDLSGARKEYLRATDIEPAFGLAWLNMGALSERNGENDRALQNYRAGLRNDPKNGQLVTATIGVLRKLGRYDEADRQARLAIKNDANNIGAYNNLGLVYLDQGKLELAQFVFQRAIMAVPGAADNAQIHANLGRVFLAQDKRPDARAELDKALELDPEIVTAMVALSDFHLENRDWQSTAELLERARELEPDNATIRLNLGIAYRGLTRNDEAIRSYEKALDLSPENLDPYLNLALLYGDHMLAFDKAIETIQRYRDLGGARLDLAKSWEADIVAKQAQVKRDQELARKREERRKAREERQRLMAADAKKNAPPPEQVPEAGSSDADGAAAPPADDGASGGAASASASASAAAAVGSSCDQAGACGTGLVCANDGVCREAGQAGTFGSGIGCMAATDCAYGMSCDSNVCQSAPVQEGSQVGAGAGTGTNWGGQ